MHAGLVVQELCESYAAILNTFKGFRFSLVEDLPSFGILLKYSQTLQQVSISRFQGLVACLRSSKGWKSTRKNW